MLALSFDSFQMPAPGDRMHTRSSVESAYSSGGSSTGPEGPVEDLPWDPLFLWIFYQMEGDLPLWPIFTVGLPWVPHPSRDVDSDRPP